jgi:hypothetical protein
VQRHEHARSSGVSSRGETLFVAHRHSYTIVEPLMDHQLNGAHSQAVQSPFIIFSTLGTLMFPVVHIEVSQGDLVLGSGESNLMWLDPHLLICDENLPSFAVSTLVSRALPQRGTLYIPPLQTRLNPKRR